METIKKNIIDFQRDCYNEYLDYIREEITKIPDPYVFPDGNPIRPVLATQTSQKSIMLVGAFPSARFERREGRLIPVANNLSPFAVEEYFDGHEMRKQASRESLEINYFNQLGIDPGKIWITDLVKIYLYPEKHIKNCQQISERTFINTHSLFSKIAKRSMKWMLREIEVCNAKLIITLGEVAARTISGNQTTKVKELLNGEIRPYYNNRLIAHLAHPEIRRINNEWNELTHKAIDRLAEELRSLNIVMPSLTPGI